MRSPICLLLFLLTSSGSAALADTFAGFDDFLQRYKAASVESRGELTESFVKWQQARGGFPIIRPDGEVVFFYQGRGDEQSVRVVGDFRTRSFYSVDWDETGEALTRAAPDGAVFFKQLKFETDARLDYKLVVDGKNGTDPLNPRTVDSGIAGDVSELAMPGYAPPEEVIPRPDVPKGRLQVVNEAWAQPRVTVYLPANYNASNRYPVAYTADGSAWINYIKLPVMLDNLIAKQAIEPIIAVLIDPTQDRSDWYYYNRDYLSYLERVVEYVDAHYSTRPRAEERLHIGSSAGGRATLYVGLERPGLFGKLGMLSPSLVGPLHYYEPYFSGKRRPAGNLRIWISAGSYEGYIFLDAQTLERYFKGGGLETRAVYTHEGHSFGTWRHVAGDMLKFFFPMKRS